MKLIYFNRKISREQYDRAVKNSGYVVKDDRQDILTEAERIGYGADCSSVFEQDGEFFARCSMYDSCD